MPKGRSGIITEEFKGKENTAYHDVEKLFKIYRSVNWKMQIKINFVLLRIRILHTICLLHCLRHF